MCCLTLMKSSSPSLASSAFAVTFGILVSERIFVVLWSWFAILSSVPYVYKEIMRWTDRWRIFFFPDTWTFAVSQRE